MRSQLHAPSYILVFLLYSNHPAIQRNGTELNIHTTPVSQDLLLSNHRFRNYLKKLQSLGLIANLTFTHGYAKIQLRVPIGMTILGESNGECKGN